MHEMSIATALMDQMNEVAQDNQLKNIKMVVLETGQLRQVIPEMMQEAFQAVVAGTFAEGAFLEIHEIPAEVRCRLCQKSFRPHLDDFLCPDCQTADVEVIAGNEILLKTIEGDTVS